MKNFYELLGVNENATQDEIKSAYRKLAMQWHPDRNSGNKEAESMFKSITEAYETLKDPKNRSQYDAMRNNPNPNMFNTPFGNNLDDILQQMFSQNGFDFAFRRGPERNRDLNFNLQITLENAFFGHKVPLQVNSPSGRRIELLIDIPSGVEHGMSIRYNGHGDQQNTKLPPGDLNIQVQIAQHAQFTRKNANLEMIVTIDALDCMLGAKKQIVCIDGSRIELEIPEGTQHGSRFRVAGRGMPIQLNSPARGDMYVAVHIAIPQQLSSEIKDKLREIQDIRSIDKSA